MNGFLKFSLNLRGLLKEFDRPAVMGIINVTPDSFYDGSRVGIDDICCRATDMVKAGADIIDVGGCSTRPGFIPPDTQTEIDRVTEAVRRVRSACPESIISVDTFRGEVAIAAVEAGADIINDISAMSLDSGMKAAVAELNVPYVLTDFGVSESATGTEAVMQVVMSLQSKVRELTLAGVNDIIVDPGFGFGKTLDQNYALMANLEMFGCIGCPVMVGVSRKSMIYRLLGINAAEALNGTTVLSTIALLKGASILRVHDVREAVEAVTIVEQLNNAVR